MPDASTCPRCQRAFGCGAREATCWCQAVAVSPALLAGLEQRFDGCLCPDCLQLLAQRPDSLQNQ